MQSQCPSANSGKTILFLAIVSKPGLFCSKRPVFHVLLQLMWSMVCATKKPQWFSNRDWFGFWRGFFVTSIK